MSCNIDSYATPVAQDFSPAVQKFKHEDTKSTKARRRQGVWMRKATSKLLRRGALIFVIALVTSSFEGCGAKLPDDLDSLIRLMNSTNETTAVAAANKVQRVFGKQGLLKALDTGGPTARAMASRWLVNFPAAEVELALIRIAKDPNEAVPPRGNALWTLGDIGTAASAPVVRELTLDMNPTVAAMARAALSKTEQRIR